MEEDLELLIEARNFFDTHKQDLVDFLRNNEGIIFIDFMQLTEFSNKLSEKILVDPEETLRIIEQAIEQSGLVSSVRVRLYNIPRSHFIRIGDIRTQHLNELIVIEGFIQKASNILTETVNAKFECPSCGSIISVLQNEKKLKEPSRCSCGRRGGFRLISREMVDTQKVIIEEIGESPKRIKAILCEDLVDPRMDKDILPGKKVRLIGIVKENSLSLNSELIIHINNIIPIEDFDFETINKNDEQQILEFSKNPRVFDIITENISSEFLYGKEIKKALVLQLLGGVKKEINGKKVSGDLHTIFIEDENISNTEILKSMLKLSSNGRYIPNDPKSNSILTASFSKEGILTMLEAGIIVAANGGLCCIDSLDEKNVKDLGSLQNCMKEQEIIMESEDIKTVLNTETSILATAKPRYKRLDLYQSLHHQIGNLPLEQFDLIFVFRDIPENKIDMESANKILNGTKEQDRTLISKEFLKKYIAYARQKITPKLSEEVNNKLREYYTNLRSKSDSINAFPISIKHLYSLIKMSEASAKIRLSETVSLEDVDVAIEILNYSLLQLGYDYESKTFEIDKIVSNIKSQTRKEFYVVLETINQLNKNYKEIPIEEINKILKDKIDESKIEEAIRKLCSMGEIYLPKKGYVCKFI